MKNTVVFMVICLFVGCEAITSNVDGEPSQTPQIEQDLRLAREQLQQQTDETNALLSNLLQEYGQNKYTFGGFIEHEGSTQMDAWGTYVSVDYTYDWPDQTMTLSSAGPDTEFNTLDDISVAKTVPNVIRSEFATWCIFGLMGYMGYIVLANGQNSRNKGSYNRIDHIAMFILCTLAGPLALAFIILTFAILISGFKLCLVPSFSRFLAEM